MGKYFVSSLLLLSFFFKSHGFINNIFKNNIQPISNQITYDKGIFNPFEKYQELSIDNNLINSCENSDEKINMLKLKLLIDKNYQLPICESKPNNLKPVTELIDEIKHSSIFHDLCDKIHHVLEFDHKTKISKPLIKYSSSLLPAMDGIAHHVLTFNQNFINFVLDNDLITLEIKKKLVLFSIQAAQNGDNMGSSILEFYYNMVNHLL